MLVYVYTYIGACTMCVDSLTASTPVCGLLAGADPGGGHGGQMTPLQPENNHKLLEKVGY